MRLSVITAQLLRDGEKNAEIPKILCALSPPPVAPCRFFFFFCQLSFEMFICPCAHTQASKQQHYGEGCRD